MSPRGGTCHTVISCTAPAWCMHVAKTDRSFCIHSHARWSMSCRRRLVTQCDICDAKISAAEIIINTYISWPIYLSTNKRHGKGKNSRYRRLDKCTLAPTGEYDWTIRARRRLFVSCLIRCNTIRYDTICYFNVRSKADVSQLNLPHGTNN